MLEPIGGSKLHLNRTTTISAIIKNNERKTTGTAVIEAMADKLPVVALNQNGVKYLVQSNCGILVDDKQFTMIIKRIKQANWDFVLAKDYSAEHKMFFCFD